MILHIDMDAFYASVEIRDDPRLRGKPVVVGGSPQGRGVVSAASYEAREFGIHSAMPAAQAIRRCPDAIFIKPRMRYYAAISRQIREIFGRYTSLVEPLSLDEAFLDVSGCVRLFGEARQIARDIKRDIRKEVGLMASAGVAPNKFLAKVASDLDKPDGLVYVDPDDIHGFLDPLPIARVWGVGPQTEKKFNSLGATTIGHVRHLPLETLKLAFGVNSDHFWRLARGLDSRQVVCDRDAKSISHETTFSFDISQRELLRAWLLELIEQVAIRLRRNEIKARTLKLKIRFSDFRTWVRSHSISIPTHTTRVLCKHGLQLLEQALGEDHPPVRLLGFGAANLSHGLPVQKSLFEWQRLEKFQRLDEQCDELREKLGATAIRSATSLQHQIRLRPDPRIEDGD